MATNSSIDKVLIPALPIPPEQYSKGYLSTLNNILRLFFNQLANTANLLAGSNGARFIESPNGLFFDTADQALVTINVAQPVRFNQTYLNNAVTIDAATETLITTTYSGVYNFQFSAVLRSTNASSKIAYIWINRDGTDIGYSAREYLISGSGEVLELNWSFSIDIQAGQYIKIMWTGDHLNMNLDAVAPTSPHPGIASAVISVSFVSILPDPLPTPP